MQKPKQPRSQWGIIVICDNEQHHIDIYSRLRTTFPALKLKVVCV